MIGNQTLTSLYLSHIAELSAFLKRRVDCRETARELAQEAFVRLLCLDDKAGIRDPRAFLFRIAGNLAIDHHRANPVKSRQFAELSECTELACEHPGPEQVVAARQALRRLRRAIDELPTQCRRVFIAHKFDGRSHVEIAAELGIARNTVEKHLVRALVHLRLAMA